MTATWKLAALSDIHGNLPALEAVLADVAAHAVDAVVDLGDIASGPLWPGETIARLAALDFPTIAGNHERQVLDTAAPLGASDAFAAARLDATARAWLRALPATTWLADDVYACHGAPASDLIMWLETLDRSATDGLRAATAAEVAARTPALAGATLALCGHSHVPRIVRTDALLIVNPGSVGLPAWSDDHPHRYGAAQGSPHARYAIVERAPDGWHVTQRAVAYDWDAAAARAAANDRPDWAHALRTGRILAPR